MTIGEKLKKAREQKKVSLEEAYRQTKLHPRVLQALEEDRAHNFLSAIYIKAFLRTYARYLKLDAEQMVKDYLSGDKEEEAAPLPIVIPQDDVSGKKPRAQLPKIDPQLFGRGIAILVVIVILVFAVRFVFARISARASAPAPERAQKAAVTKPQKAKAAAATPVSDSEALIVEVRTKEDCWLRVDADDQVVFQRTLEKGRVERWQGNEKVELRIGKPEALEIRLNGALINLEENEVKKGLVITRQSIIGK